MKITAFKCEKCNSVYDSVCEYNKHIRGHIKSDNKKAAINKAVTIVQNSKSLDELNCNLINEYNKLSKHKVSNVVINVKLSSYPYKNGILRDGAVVYPSVYYHGVIDYTQANSCAISRTPSFSEFMRMCGITIITGHGFGRDHSCSISFFIEDFFNLMNNTSAVLLDIDETNRNQAEAVNKEINRLKRVYSNDFQRLTNILSQISSLQEEIRHIQTHIISNSNVEFDNTKIINDMKNIKKETGVCTYSLQFINGTLSSAAKYVKIN